MTLYKCNSCKHGKNCPIDNDAYLEANFGERFVQSVKDRFVELCGCAMGELK